MVPPVPVPAPLPPAPGVEPDPGVDPVPLMPPEPGVAPVSVAPPAPGVEDEPLSSPLLVLQATAEATMSEEASKSAPRAANRCRMSFSGAIAPLKEYAKRIGTADSAAARI